ncbi:MAG: redoxin domain-containing protein [Planctomycetes bacterium]|nr:redoxin domain-containing protein [Planctomycetota bacterium]
MRLKYCAGGLLLAAFTAVATAGDSIAEKLAAIKKDYKAAEEAFYKPPKGTPKISSKEFEKRQSELFQAAVDLAKTEPKSDDALDALEFVLTVPRAYYLPAGIPAMELATEHHAANPKVAKIVAWLGYYPPHDRANPKEYKAASALIHAVAERNQDRTARGQAMMALAWEVGRKFGAVEFKNNEESEKLAAAAEKAFDLILKDYSDCPRMMRKGQRTLGDEAKGELFEIRNLRIGKTAPDIEAEDLDGAKFKLSDYRGKVVVIDFWGDW